MTVAYYSNWKFLKTCEKNETWVNTLAESASPRREINSTWKKEKKFKYTERLISCQYIFLDIFPVCDKFLLYFQFIFQSDVFYIISCKKLKNILRFAPIATFLHNYVSRIQKFSGISRHLKVFMKILSCNRVKNGLMSRASNKKWL